MSVMAGSKPAPTAGPSLADGVAAALWVWDSLDLEIGDVAVITDGHPWSRLLTLVATFYGARPVFVSKAAEPPPQHVTHLHWTGAEQDARQLATMLKGAPGVVVAELSGEAGLVDLVLEAVPAGSRVMLAGLAGDHLTIDFYQNVHIKGLHLVSGSLEGAPTSSTRALRVQRLLARPAIASGCRGMLDASGPPNEQ